MMSSGRGVGSITTLEPAECFSGSDFQGTLDEPVMDTVLRDVRSIGQKMYYVLLPKARVESAARLRDWDLWGPLFLCIILSIILWAQAVPEQKKLLFSLVFVIVWFGSGVLTMNAVLLGGTLSFFQSVCVLGYCLLPLDIAALMCHFVPRQIAFLKLVLLIIALYWSTGASSGFMSNVVAQDRKALAIYPVWLFYVVLAWIILLV